MTSPFADQVAALLRDAVVAAAAEDWDALRSLTAAVLALDPTNEDARQLRTTVNARSGGAGERRQLTVMFCDVVGSTALSEQADPEVLRDLLQAYQNTCDAIVSRYDGYVARYFGDGLLAYFGHPHVHEDDPRRAVHAGLELLGALASTAAEAHGDPALQVRIAVHTGLVVRAEMGSAANPDRDAIVGETPNLAARLQEWARPGSLVISENTYELVRNHFEVEPLGALQLKGITRAVHAYQVIGEARRSVAARARAASMAFVDRQHEWEILAARWDEALKGAAACVAIQGEPGIGKSRLIERLSEFVQGGGDGAMVLVGAASSYHTSTQLFPARRVVEAACGIDRRDVDGARVALRDALRGIECEEHVGLFVSLLDLPPAPWCRPPELDGLALREAMLSALLHVLAALARTSPVLLAIDDVQWADPSTLELLTRLAARKIPRLMMVIGMRPEFALPWRTETIELHRLEPEHLRDMAAAFPAAASLPPDLIADITQRSDGVPLYFEELLRAASEPVQAHPGAAVTAGPTAFTIPPALRDPLLARLSQPGIDLELAQTMATIGREVSHDVLCAVAARTPGEVTERAHVLVAARLVDAEPREPTVYRFRHHLIGQLAYETQLLPKRRERHGAVADALRRLGGERLTSDAGALAYHLEHAGRTAEAVEAYVGASMDAQAHGAYAEAAEQLGHALEVLTDIEDEQRRWTLELTVRRVRGFGAIAVFGYFAPGASEDFERCLELCAKLEPRREHLASLAAVWSYYTIRGELDRAEDINREIRVVEQHWPVGERTYALPEEAAWGVTRFFRGDFAGSISAIEEFLASPFATAALDDAWDSPLPNDFVAATAGNYAFALLLTGEFDRSDQALARARERAMALPFPVGPFTVGYVETFAAMVHWLRGDFATALNSVERIAELAERHGFVFYSMCAAVQRAIGATIMREPNGSGLLEGAVAMWRGAGADVWMPPFVAQLATARLDEGSPEIAAGLVRDAIDLADRTGAQFWTAELLRIHGLARHALGDINAVEDIDAAITVARAQGARLFEVHARLARLDVAGRDTANAEALAGLLDSFSAKRPASVIEVARAALVSYGA